MQVRGRILAALIGTSAMLGVAPANGDPTAAVPLDDGSVQVPAGTLPFSAFASEEARQAFIESTRMIRQIRAAPPLDITAAREKTVAHMTPLLQSALARYPAVVEARQIAGVATDVVTPAAGVDARNRRRVLINLHNGGFFVGAGISGKVEAVPIAGLGGFRVIAVDYRQGPEYRFPAASEDVTRVYRELLKHYPARNIGIYGCSAGGLLTTEVVALLQSRGLPAPGAIGIFCASAGGWAGGDSTYTTAAYGIAGVQPSSPHYAVSDAAYFSAADMRDPLVAPIVSAPVLARFPPTLVITGTRDVAMSSAIFTHARLVELGVDAELHVWDGLGHAFLLDPNLPESREAYRIIVRFFERHLGH